MDFKNLTELQEHRLNHVLAENKEKQERLRPVYDKLRDYSVEEIWELNELVIAKIRSRRGELLYTAFLNYKQIHNFALSFDEALLIGLGYKYDGEGSNFSVFAKRMLHNLEMNE